VTAIANNIVKRSSVKISPLSAASMRLFGNRLASQSVIEPAGAFLPAAWADVFAEPAVNDARVPGSTDRREVIGGVRSAAKSPDATNINTNSTMARTPSFPTDLAPALLIAESSWVITSGKTVSCRVAIKIAPTALATSPNFWKAGAAVSWPRIPRPRPAASATSDHIVSESRFKGLIYSRLSKETAYSKDVAGIGCAALSLVLWSGNDSKIIAQETRAVP